MKYKGTFNGKNLYVVNPPVGDDYCVISVAVNGKSIAHNKVAKTAFEIDLINMGFKKGKKLTVDIIRQQGCTPKVINLEVIR